MSDIQVNFDGLSGPTHFYGGLAYGNVASMTHKKQHSNPKAAALQGLQKMRLLMDLGIPQAVIPPHERPSIFHLRKMGYTGSNRDILQQADAELLKLFSSSSSMWTANAATVTPSSDSQDGKLHLTVANLATEAHRSIEAEQTYLFLQKIFPFAKVHPPLPACFGDEGAANHIRLNNLHLFVYGRTLADKSTHKYPARQFKEAQEAIIRQHGIKKSLLLKQNPKAIEAGVFHNDVISMGINDLFIYHKEAFENEPKLPCQMIRVDQISLKEAVKSYLFNSQLIYKDKKLLLIAPKECERLDLSFLPIDEIHFVDLKQSMENGGGPACLRLCVLLNKEEVKKIHSGVMLTLQLYEELVNWVEKHYRDRLDENDLRDEQFLNEVYLALNELSTILKLGSIYPFQH